MTEERKNKKEVLSDDESSLTDEIKEPEEPASPGARPSKTKTAAEKGKELAPIDTKAPPRDETPTSDKVPAQKGTRREPPVRRSPNPRMKK